MTEAALDDVLKDIFKTKAKTRVLKKGPEKYVDSKPYVASSKVLESDEEIAAASTSSGYKKLFSELKKEKRKRKKRKASKKTKAKVTALATNKKVGKVATLAKVKKSWSRRPWSEAL